jgi:outer membrane protein
MKKNLMILSAVLALFSFNASAAGVGVIDVEKIVKESKLMRDIQSKLGKKQEEYQKEVTAKQNVFEADQKKLEGRKNVLSKEAMEKEIAGLNKKAEELKAFLEKKENSLKKASLDSMSKANEKIKEIIADVAKEKEFDLVIPMAETLYGKDELDITSEVLTRLNKKITKLDVKFE